jgi:hypothetical protein
MAVGCKRCPIFSVCPAKGVIGDYKADESASTKEKPASTSGTKKK